MPDWPKCSIGLCTAEADYEAVYISQKAEWSGTICQKHADEKLKQMRPSYVSQALLRVISYSDIDRALKNLE